MCGLLSKKKSIWRIRRRNSIKFSCGALNTESEVDRHAFPATCAVFKKKGQAPTRQQRPRPPTKPQRGADQSRNLIRLATRNGHLRRGQSACCLAGLWRAFVGLRCSENKSWRQLGELCFVGHLPQSECIHMSLGERGLLHMEKSSPRKGLCLARRGM